MKIMLFHAEAGYGHKKAADVLAKMLLEKGNPPQEILIEDALDLMPSFFKKIYLSYYFYSVKYAPALWGWSYYQFDHEGLYRIIQPLRSLVNRVFGQRVLKKVLAENPDVLISTHFLPAELLARFKKENKIRGPVITVITDIYPHCFWINEGTDAYWVMHEDTRQKLIQRNVRPESIFAGGIPIAASFKPGRQKKQLREKYGFDPDRFTVLLASGSFGVGDYLAVLNQLESFQDKIQCFVVCGNNQKLKKFLEMKTYLCPVRIFGFVDFMPDLMEASDVMLSKAGGLSMAESLAKEIPLIVTGSIPGQESYNAAFLKKQGCSFFAEKPDQIRLLIGNMLRHPHLLEMKREAIRRVAKPQAAEDLAEFVLAFKHPHPP